MKLKGQLTLTDYLNSQLLHFHPAGSGIVLLFVAVFIMTVNLLGGRFLGGGAFPTEYMILGLVFIAFIVLFRYVLFPYSMKQMFFQQKDLGLPFELELTEASIILSNERGTRTHPWAGFTKWKENRDLLLLYHADRTVTILPKWLFSDPKQVETIKTFLEKNKIPVAKSGYLYLFGCVLIFFTPACIAAAFVVYVVNTASP